jgi:hypothetical protein
MGRQRYQERNLREAFVELLHVDWGQRSNRERRDNAEQHKTALVDHHQCLPESAPVLADSQ